MDGQFKFNTYFKSTDRNSFIPRDSCHHSSWLNAVPRSQFLRLRRNCTDVDTFISQAEVLKQRFLDKGYNQADLDTELQRVTNIDRNTLLVTKQKRDPDTTYKWALSTTYSIQHKQIKSIMRKHWGVLRQDNILGKILPEQAKIIFRGAPSLQGQVAPNIINPPARPSFFHDWTGFYPCKKCVVCRHNIPIRRKLTEFTSTVTGKRYTIKPFCTCNTRYIVYLIVCPCGKQYVGRTTRTFTKRVSEHISLIKSRDSKHSVPRHYKEVHNSDPTGSLFMIIDKYTPPWRGGALTRGVSRLEMFWIHELRSLYPRGMNVDLDINAFINES